MIHRHNVKYVASVILSGLLLTSVAYAAINSFVSTELESATRTANAQLVSDASASTAQAVKFGTSAGLTCNINATPANFSSSVSSATAGQTICLATGSYGTWNGTNKAITITKQAGATPSLAFNFASGDANFTLDGLTITDGNIAGNSGNYNDANNPKNITIRNSTFTAAVNIEYIANANILFDNNTHNNIDNNASCTARPARIQLSYSSNTPSGVTIQNSLMDGGNADGIQAGTAFVARNNIFRNIKEKSSSDCAHTDPIQLVGTKGAHIVGNFIHNSADGIVAYDGVEDALIEHNVINLVNGRYGIELYADKNSIVRHNTLVYGTGCEYVACGQIILDHKSQDPAGVGTVIENNIASGINMDNGSTAAVNRNNMLRSGASGSNFIGTPVYAGGASPTSYSGFLLAGGSPGKNAASDGTDVGIGANP